jgi:hypothetical protein
MKMTITMVISMMYGDCTMMIAYDINNNNNEDDNNDGYINDVW